MSVMSIAAQKAFLTAIGVPSATTAQRKSSWQVFQAASAWHYFDKIAKKAGTLDVDRAPGPLTQAHVAAPKAAGNRIAPHFWLAEFVCGAEGNTHVQNDRDLFRALETFRAERAPGGVTIVSGYRCAAHNKAVGGSKTSAHLLGKTADICPHVKPANARGFGFHGIGIRDGVVIRAVPARVRLAAKRCFIRTTCQSYAATIPTGGVFAAVIMSLLED